MESRILDTSTISQPTPKTLPGVDDIIEEITG